ncbi:MAG: hypothetical protein ICV71_07995 [Thermoleophilia bacterium]|nr:hypothetical protein [Thermoleophilia bacterium]
MSSTEWEETGDEETELVDPDEIDDAPAGSGDDVTGAEEGEPGAGSSWTSGGGTLGPESSDEV